MSFDEVHTSVESLLGQIRNPVQLGDLVVYEFLDQAGKWHWSLARVVDLDEHCAVLQCWRVENRRNTGILDTLRKERERKLAEIREGNRSVLQLREELATIRRNNETEAARVKEAVDITRNAVADVEEVLLHEIFNARLPQAVLCQTLETAVAILYDEMPENGWGWEELRAVVRDPFFLPRLLKYDALAEMDAEKHKMITDRYMKDLFLLREQVHRPSAVSPTAASAPVTLKFCDWAIAQMELFSVFQEIQGSQKTTDGLHEAITRLVAHLKDRKSVV